jgi:hypothetical protein
MIGTTVGAAIIGVLLGTAITIRNPLMIRLDDDYLNIDSSQIPLGQAEELEIDRRRFLGPVLWVTVDGTRRGIALPNAPGMVTEIERRIRSITASSPKAPEGAVRPPKNCVGSAATSTAAEPGDIIEWPEGFANNQLFRWVLPALASFTVLVFAFAGVGAVVAHIFTLMRPGLRAGAIREYFDLAVVMVGYCLIFFGGGGLAIAVLRNRNNLGMVRLTDCRILLRDRRISLFRIAAAEVCHRRLPGPQLRLFVGGRWVVVGLPRDGKSIGGIVEFLRSRGKTVSV